MNEVRLYVVSKDNCYHCKNFFDGTWQEYLKESQKPFQVGNMIFKLGGTFHKMTSRESIIQTMKTKLSERGYGNLDLSDIPLPESVPAFYVQVSIVGRQPEFFYLEYLADKNEIHRDLQSIKNKIVEAINACVN